MTYKDDIELKVCKQCDAPLPCNSSKLSYFNFNALICDDCFKNPPCYENKRRKKLF